MTDPHEEQQQKETIERQETRKEKVAIGERLRQAREERGLSLIDVEQATRIRRKFLRALEEERTDVFSGWVHLRGFLRNYALFLGMDPDEMVEVYRKEVWRRHEESPRVFAPQKVLAQRRPLLRLDLLILFGAVVVLLLVALWGDQQGWWSLGVLPDVPTAVPTTAVPEGMETGTPEPTSEVDRPLVLPTPTPRPTNTPVPTPTATPTPTVLDRVVLTVRAVDRAWMQVVVDGEEVFAGFMEPGEEQTWEGQEYVTLSTGNAGGIEVIVNGAELPPLGEPGEVVRRTWEVGETLVEPTPTP